MNTLKKIVVLMFVAGLFAGCANRATATLDPSADLSGIETIHVLRHAKDKNNVNELIADKLRTKGYIVTTSEEKRTDVDAVVTYTDKWMWDITMYLLELTINFRDPKNDYPLASGNSYHTSLTRKSPPEMVDEVIENILSSGK